jgi:N-acetylmuramoyl-L-alanine amidase
MKQLITLALGAVLFATNLNTQAENAELICLAKNIYFEARGEPYRGKLAVAQVTLNRVKSPNFSNTICGVVYQPYQFSWTLTYKKITDKVAWNAALSLADKVLDGTVKMPNFRATYFHAKSVRPKWAKNKTLVATIGNHVFYERLSRNSQNG